MLSLFRAQHSCHKIRTRSELKGQHVLLFEMDFSKMDFIRAPFFRDGFQEFQETKLENPAGVFMHHF